MLIIGLNGSPRQKGDTAVLLKTVLEEAAALGAETDVIPVSEIMDGQESPYCTVCTNPCSGQCYQGTRLEEEYARLKAADALVLGSPVYFGTVSAQLKAFWDKTRKLRGEKALYNTVGGAVSSGGARFGGQETTLRALHDMMIVQGMLIVGDGFRENDCGHHGACAQRPAAEDEFALKRARILGRRLVEVARATTDIRGL